MVCAGCTVGELDVVGKACPCPDGFSCDDDSQTCVEGNAGSGAAGSAYAAEILADEPLAYYRLGESETPTAFDASGNERHATYKVVKLSMPGAIAGDPDTAVRFDGDGVVEGGDWFGFEGAVAFSIEAWVLHECGEGVDTDCAFVGKVQYNPSESLYHGWFLYHHPMSTTFRRVLNTEAPLPSAGQFNHVVATHDGVTSTVYLNGEEAISRSNEEPVVAHSFPFTIGRIDNWAPFVGVLDEVAVYGHHLSAERVKAHHEVGRGAR